MKVASAIPFDREARCLVTIRQLSRAARHAGGAFQPVESDTVTASVGGPAAPGPADGRTGSDDERQLNPVNHYDVLGVPADATLAQIRAAYRQAAHHHHPDRNAGDPVAEARFKALAAAYRVLRQPALRRAYDREIGLGGNWKPWYGEPEASRPETGHALPPEALEQIALQLALANRWSAPRIAAHLAAMGCSYRSAWQIAWRARYQVLNESLEQMLRREAADIAQAVPPAPEGKAHVGRPRLVEIPAAPNVQAHRPHATSRTGRHGAMAGNRRSLVEFRPSVWITRIHRLRRVLAGIKRLLGFQPPALAREQRKRLRLEYERRAAGSSDRAGHA